MYVCMYTCVCVYIYICMCVHTYMYVCMCVCVCVIDLMTGKLWAIENTEKSNHELFQALWKPLHKYTDQNRANLQQT